MSGDTARRQRSSVRTLRVKDQSEQEAVVSVSDSTTRPGGGPESGGDQHENGAREERTSDASEWSEESSDVQKGFAVLPEEVLVSVFGRLPVRGILNCKQVCQRWSDAARHPTVWKLAAASLYTLTEKNINAIEAFRKTCTPAPSWRYLVQQWETSLPLARRTVATCGMDLTDSATARRGFGLRVRKRDPLFIVENHDASDDMWLALNTGDSRLGLVSSYNLPTAYHSQQFMPPGYEEPDDDDDDIYAAEARRRLRLESAADRGLVWAAVLFCLVLWTIAVYFKLAFGWGVPWAALLLVVDALLYCAVKSVLTYAASRNPRGRWDTDLVCVGVALGGLLLGVQLFVLGLQWDSGERYSWFEVLTPLLCLHVFGVLLPLVRFQLNEETERQHFSSVKLIYLYVLVPALLQSGPFATTVLAVERLEYRQGYSWSVVLLPLWAWTATVVCALSVHALWCRGVSARTAFLVFVDTLRIARGRPGVLHKVRRRVGELVVALFVLPSVALLVVVLYADGVVVVPAVHRTLVGLVALLTALALEMIAVRAIEPETTCC